MHDSVPKVGYLSHLRSEFWSTAKAAQSQITWSFLHPCCGKSFSEAKSVHITVIGRTLHMVVVVSRQRTDENGCAQLEAGVSQTKI